MKMPNEIVESKGSNSRMIPVLQNTCWYIIHSDSFSP